MPGLFALIAVGAIVVCTGARVDAQVITDGSLGPAGPVAGGLLPDGTTATYRIDESLGQRRGGNLFQSFSEFSIGGGQSAAFTADAPTERVLARVTGGIPSIIDGQLRSAIPGADLYLLNPRGVIFGQGSSLDVQGSLYLSTADSLRLADGTSFSTVPVAGEVLSVAAPSAWGFADDGDIGAIRLTSSLGLAVSAGETLSVVARDVSVRGVGTASSVLAAPGGTISLAARNTPGEIPVDVAELDARGAESGELGSVRIGPRARLDASDVQGASSSRGKVVIRAGQLVIDLAEVSVDSARDALDGTADVDLETTDSIAISGSSRLNSFALESARAGAFRLSSADIEIRDASIVQTRAAGTGVAGAVEIDADTLRLTSRALVGSSAGERAATGNVRVDVDALDITDGAQLSATTEGEGRGGDVEIRAADSVRVAGAALTGPSGIFARSGLGPGFEVSGDGGSISIRARTVSVENAAEISAAAYGTGDAGSIRIEAEDGVRIAGGDLGTASINAKGQDGASGNLEISTSELRVENDGAISASTGGTGDAGDVVIDAQRVRVGGGAPVRVETAGIFARSIFQGAGASGAGGDIVIRARESLELQDGGRISVETSTSGDAGNIYIHGSERVSILDGAIGASTESLGRSGNIFIDQVDSLEVGSSGSVATETQVENGAGGDIHVAVHGDVQIANGGRISANTFGTGAGGSVDIRAARIFVGGTGATDGAVATISAQSLPAQGTAAPGDGGDVVLRAAKKLALRDGGQVSVKSTGDGAAGSVEIAGTKWVRIRDGAISATSEGAGAGGSVTLDGVGELHVGRFGAITSETLGSGPGGAIDIDANREIVVANGGAISARSEGTGNAGSISIDAGQQFTARDGGRVTTEADAASGGSIDIRARHLIYIREGELTTSVAGGSEDGGNITLDPEFVVFDHATVVARAVAGNGGNILIQTSHYVPDVDSVVDASSELGIDGEIQITSPGIDLTSELATLDSDFLDASSQLVRACAARSAANGTFVVRGRARNASPDAPLEASDAAAHQAGCPAPKQP